MVLDLYNLIIRAIHIASEIHEINHYLVKAPLRDDWFNKGFLDSLSHRVINIAPTNDFRNVIKSDSIVLFKDNFMGLGTAY
jgi:hypothetical protein